MILIAIGANLPDATGRAPAATCRWAVDQVAAVTGLALVACSRWYRSAPVPPSGQPDYVNGVARYTGPADPHLLLARLHEIEALAGRVRSVADAARPLDLDLLAIDGLCIDCAGLVLPHPRMRQRAFVLAPLRDVAPDWTDARGESAAVLLQRADRRGITLLESP